MLNSKLYDEYKVWEFLQELFDYTEPNHGDKFQESWSFSQLCEKFGLHQVYGTVINQETTWMKDGQWNTIYPRIEWVKPLISKVQAYSARAQHRCEEKKLRTEQQQAFSEAMIQLDIEHTLGSPEWFDAIKELCDEFVIFKDAK